MPYGNDGGSAWNATRCSPIAPDPAAPGDPCTFEGSSNSGIDTCELHSICWDFDTNTNEGTCASMCIGTQNAPMCPEVDQMCTINGQGTLALCIPMCDPLSQDCDAGEACYPIDEGFVCAPDASEEGGGQFEPCEFPNACAAGFVRIAPTMAPACDTDAGGCCAPYCSAGDNTCPSGTLCLPWFEEGHGPVGFQDIGVCRGEQ